MEDDHSLFKHLRLASETASQDLTNMLRELLVIYREGRCNPFAVMAPSGPEWESSVAVIRPVHLELQYIVWVPRKQKSACLKHIYIYIHILSD